MRQNQAQPQLPADVRNYGVTIQKSSSAPLMIFSVYSPNGTHDATFLANYAYINLNDQLLRVPGVAMATVWGRAVCDTHLGQARYPGQARHHRPDIINAVQKQNTVNPAGQIGGEPAPPGQEFTYTVRAQGRLISPEEFGQIVIRANPTGPSSA